MGQLFIKMWYLAGLDAGFLKRGSFWVILSKLEHIKFLNVHHNTHENEIILSKSGVRATPLNPPLDPPQFGSGTLEWSPAEMRFNIYMYLLWDRTSVYRLIRTTNGDEDRTSNPWFGRRAF